MRHGLFSRSQCSGMASESDSTCVASVPFSLTEGSIPSVPVSTRVGGVASAPFSEGGLALQSRRCGLCDCQYCAGGVACAF